MFSVILEPRLHLHQELHQGYVLEKKNVIMIASLKLRSFSFKGLSGEYSGFSFIPCLVCYFSSEIIFLLKKSFEP